MNQLTIVDLSFCEDVLATNSEVQGGTKVGVTVYSPTGAFSTSGTSSNSSGYYTDYFVNKNTGAFGYKFGYGYAVAAAGAAAAAAGVTDDPVYVSVYTSVTTVS